MYRVAIVDDSFDVRALWRAELEASGQFVVCAEGDDGRQAVEIAAQARPDVMLLDLSMPGLDGMQALPLILAASPDTRVVVLSAMGRGRFSGAALEQGAVAFLEKNQTRVSLPARLHQVLEAPAAVDSTAPTVLTVEPNDDDRALLHYLLGWLGCSVQHTRTGEEALELLAAHHVDVVFTAAVLPDMTATQFAAQLRRWDRGHSKTPLVVVSDVPAEAVLAEDFAALLHKPVAAEALGSVLSRYGTPRGAAPDSLIDGDLLAELRERIGRDPLRDVVRGFGEATRDRLSALHLAVEASDADAIVRLAHQIDGSARSLSASLLARAAADLEHAVGTESTAELQERAGRLQLLFDDTDRALRTSLPRQRTSEEGRARRVLSGSVRLVRRAEH